ncbi:MAG: glycosyltransferase [Candidatus Omnitrophota bacterium]|nr:glycosyltransferase [Candidatus Omnitrophota bacterium]MBU1929408.1 glycosyltransferase [Candidatus Omnitrophota bacterium]MBU2034283.1 glycosyltransferase [Candidatus Omnitrophota bacterium]MBU2258383.1 glycosyltransferase [Candidatus Omnitrophota bacterium]
MFQKVAVIVPVKGIPYYFVKCMASLLALDYPDYELIVVDDGLEPGILSALSKFSEKVRILKSESRGPSFARNLAASNTDAGLIAFTDSDCVLERSWLKELVKGLEQFPEAVSCGGIQKSPDDASKFQKDVFSAFHKTGRVCEYMRSASVDQVTEVDHNASCNVIYKRDIFLKEGGFFEGLWPGEDVELDCRLRKKGLKIVFNPKAVVYHYRPESLKKVYQMMLRYGMVQAFLIKKYGIFRKVQLVPFILLFFIMIMLLTGIKGLTVGLILLIWGLLILVAYFLSLRAVIIFLITIVSWNAGFLKGLFMKSPLAKK